MTSLLAPGSGPRRSTSSCLVAASFSGEARHQRRPSKGLGIERVSKSSVERFDDPYDDWIVSVELICSSRSRPCRGRRPGTIDAWLTRLRGRRKRSLLSRRAARPRTRQLVRLSPNTRQEDIEAQRVRWSQGARTTLSRVPTRRSAFTLPAWGRFRMTSTQRARGGIHRALPMRIPRWPTFLHARHVVLATLRAGL